MRVTITRSGYHVRVTITRSGQVVPVVGQLQLEARVVGCLNDDDVGAEVGAQQQAQRADLIGPLGFFPGQTQLRKLLVRT